MPKPTFLSVLPLSLRSFQQRWRFPQESVLRRRTEPIPNNWFCPVLKSHLPVLCCFLVYSWALALQPYLVWRERAMLFLLSAATTFSCTDPCPQQPLAVRATCYPFSSFCHSFLWIDERYPPSTLQSLFKNPLPEANHLTLQKQRKSLILIFIFQGK